MIDTLVVSQRCGSGGSRFRKEISVCLERCEHVLEVWNRLRDAAGVDVLSREGIGRLDAGGCASSEPV